MTETKFIDLCEQEQKLDGLSVALLKGCNPADWAIKSEAHLSEQA